MPEFTVPEEYNGENIKTFLRNYCSVSSRLLTDLKKYPNGITIKGNRMRSVDIIYTGDIVKIEFPPEKTEIVAVNLPLNIVYEDNDIIIIDKPPFMPVHPVHGHIDDTLANGLAYYAQSKGEIWTFRAINRIDRDTSGLVLAAKNTYSASLLSGKVEKVYIALCEGELFGEGTIDAPIRLKEGHKIQREVGEGGVRAITHWKSIMVKNNHTLLSIKLETGRTHQIRVHFSSMGFPLAGDDMYGGSRKYFERQCLHCAGLEFIHPISKNKMTIKSKMPDWIKDLEK